MESYQELTVLLSRPSEEFQNLCGAHFVIKETMKLLCAESRSTQVAVQHHCSWSLLLQ